MGYDYSDAPEQDWVNLIPAKTLVKVVLTIRPGRYGEDGLLSRSGSGFEYLNLEATVISEPYRDRKIYQNVAVGGATEGQRKAAAIARPFIRGILESARGIKPKDESQRALQARRINKFADLIDLKFAVEIGIEKGKDGYDDKNTIKRAITPDRPFYDRIMAGTSIEAVDFNDLKRRLPDSSQPESSLAGKNKAGQGPPVHPAPDDNDIPEWAR
jgi:hypothetical protein